MILKSKKRRFLIKMSKRSKRMRKMMVCVTQKALDRPSAPSYGSRIRAQTAIHPVGMTVTVWEAAGALCLGGASRQKKAILVTLKFVIRMEIE